MAYSVGMVSLGCEKNRVDAEIMMASLEKAGFTLKDDAALADVAIVNTCGSGFVRVIFSPSDIASK